MAFYVLSGLVMACGPGNVGGSGSGTTGAASTTSNSDGADDESHGFQPDPVECSVPTCTDITGTYDPAGCCQGLQPSTDTDDSACPSNTYPNNWTCDGSGNCIHGGCMEDGDCPGSMRCLDPDEDAATISFCVTTCETTPDSCNYGVTGLLCSGVAYDDQQVAHGYCRQHPFPE